MPRRATKTAHTAAASIARRDVRGYMDKLGYTWKDMARLVGLTVRTLRADFARGFPSQRTRVAIENAIGAAIFTTPEEFNLRQHHKALLGEDPVLIHRDKLRALARSVGISSIEDHKDRATLLKKLLPVLEVRNLSRPKPQPTHRHD